MAAGERPARRARPRRPEHDYSLEEERGVKKSWPKLVVLHFLMLSSSFGCFWLVGRVKGGRSPAKRTLDAARFTPTLQGSGQAWLFSPAPRARPAARTAPPLGRG